MSTRVRIHPPKDLTIPSGHRYCVVPAHMGERMLLESNFYPSRNQCKACIRNIKKGKISSSEAVFDEIPSASSPPTPPASLSEPSIGAFPQPVPINPLETKIALTVKYNMSEEERAATEELLYSDQFATVQHLQGAFHLIRDEIRTTQDAVYDISLRLEKRLSTIETLLRSFLRPSISSGHPFPSLPELSGT